MHTGPQEETDRYRVDAAAQVSVVGVAAVSMLISVVRFEGSAWTRYNHLFVVFANSPLNGWLSNCVLLFLTEWFVDGVNQKRKDGANGIPVRGPKLNVKSDSHPFWFVLCTPKERPRVQILIPAAVAKIWPKFAREPSFMRKFLIQSVAAVIFF